MVYRKAIHLIELIAPPPPLPVLSCLHMTIQRMSSTNLFALFFVRRHYRDSPVVVDIIVHGLEVTYFCHGVIGFGVDARQSEGVT